MSSKEKKPANKISNKTKLYSGMLVVGIAATSYAVFFKNNVTGEPVEKVEVSGNETVNTPTLSAEYIEGRLEVSDNSERGNLKLKASMGDIYLRTERDFSALVGSDVLVRIEGTFENFRMLDIEKRVEKDGYIQN